MSKGKQSEERIGVLLFNLGGPDTLEDVRPFLFNLFADPDIIRLPWRAMQKPLAWLISSQRYKKSRGYYEKIGGGSPLRKITEEQARALEGALAARNISARAYVGMRYWNPFIEEALEEIRRDQITHLVVLPLYPQFSISTTGSSLNQLNALASKNGRDFPRTSVICSWEDDANYIAALAASVSEMLDQFPDKDPSRTHIVFSAHSVPVRYIKEGDPYLDHTKRTVELVMQRLGSERPHTLSFQSKVGPVEWLTPATNETIPRLAREGVSQLLLVPVSFVSEHSETLYEMDILYRDVAKEAGIAHYLRVPTMNCRADFIGALADLVERAIALDSQNVSRSNCVRCASTASNPAATPQCACERAGD
ncbi:MAG TPA: ferrochelatase [Blastocatellia bacterium]|nr:ferrochelatase [Blastocatellia bacterium]